MLLELFLAIYTALPYIKLMQVVVETPDYLVDVKAVGLTDDERKAIVDFIAETPDAGDEMRGTRGCRED